MVRDPCASIIGARVGQRIEPQDWQQPPRAEFSGGCWRCMPRLRAHEIRRGSDSRGRPTSGVRRLRRPRWPRSAARHGRCAGRGAERSAPKPTEKSRTATGAVAKAAQRARARSGAIVRGTGARVVVPALPAAPVETPVPLRNHRCAGCPDRRRSRSTRTARIRLGHVAPRRHRRRSDRRRPDQGRDHRPVPDAGYSCNVIVNCARKSRSARAPRPTTCRGHAEHQRVLLRGRGSPVESEVIAMPIRTEVLMGTSCDPLVPDVKHGAAATSAFGWFREIEEVCSRFDPRSELMRLCGAGRAVAVSPILSKPSARPHRRGGHGRPAFDPTVGAEMAARGFTTITSGLRAERSAPGNERHVEH